MPEWKRHSLEKEREECSFILLISFVCVCLDFADSGISKTHLDLPNNPNS